MEDEFRELDAQNGWAQLFQQIRNESSNFDFTMKEAKKTQNKNLNRYRDVSPYDHSRVKLECGVDGDYINASLLEVSDARRSYILTQGPLPNTTGHFWQMVWERNSKAVLMLNRVIEKNTVKCHQYWPLGSRHNSEDVLELPTVGLRVEYVSESEATYYLLRRLKLTELKSGESRIVLHFHYTTWPDFSVPQSPSAFLDFLFAVRDSGVLDENVGPPVVHCSAGIGRSGTFCLVDSCLVLIEKYQDLNVVDVKKMLLEMRKYRVGLIQTPDQLRFSYLAILEGAKRVSLFTAAKSNEESMKNSKRLSVDSEKDVDEVLKNGNVDDVDDNNGDDDDNDDDEDDGDDDNTTEEISSSLDSKSSQIEIGNSVSAASKHRWLHQVEEAPPLPPKRRRSNSKELDNDSNDVNSEDVVSTRRTASVEGEVNELVGCGRFRCKSISADNAVAAADGASSGCGLSSCADNDLLPLLDGSDAKEGCMTMKDGAVVTNFGERLREAELRKRQRKEQNEKMRDKIRTMQQKQHDSEKTTHSRLLSLVKLKPITSAVGLLLILGGGYLVYRYIWRRWRGAV